VSASGTQPTRHGRFDLVGKLGIEPTVADIVRGALDAAFAAADERHGDHRAQGGAAAVLDAGCGRVSALRPYRARIGRFVGADIHPPASGALPHLDEFAAVDLCADADAFPPATFDIILSSFTVEHFADPSAAFRHLRGWLRPGGRLVISTVNRRHPFVRTYLAIPERLRRPLQRLVKASDADAHPLVGACNDPAAIERALLAAGFTDVRVTTVGHLARAWGRRRATFALGLAGDLLARGTPSRRSTIVAEATAPLS
jgi:SAM-dependent methyltransferase